MEILTFKSWTATKEFHVFLTKLQCRITADNTANRNWLTDWLIDYLTDWLITHLRDTNV